jgi:predicted permease
MRPWGSKRLFRFGTRSRDDIRTDIADEVAFHLEMRTAALVQEGIPAEEARAQARREFGSQIAHDAACTVLDVATERRSRITRWVGEAVQDTRVGLRVLRRTPGFAAAAILTLALGIGANTAIYSLLDAVLLRPLPWPEPDRLAVLWETRPDGGTNSASGGAFLDWRAHQTQFSHLVITNPVAMNLREASGTERVSGMEVSHEFLDVLGVPALLGRGFLPEEDRPGGPTGVVMLTEEFWRGRFGGDTGILGRTLILDDEPRVVVGVLPRRAWLFPTDGIFVPAVLRPGTARAGRAEHWGAVFGRLAPGATMASADAELRRIKSQLDAEYPVYKRAWGVRAQPVGEALGTVTRTPMLLLFGAVSLLLLIACANVANLVLARGRHREQELATRAALGAGSSRLVRQLLTESLTLAVIGGGLGVVVAAGVLRVLTMVAADALPIAFAPQLNGRVLGATFLITLATGAVFGLLPAVRARRPSLSIAIGNGGRRSTASGQHRTQSLLVMAQVALTMVLLAAAGLLLRSLANTANVDDGFDAGRVLAFDVSLPVASYRDKEARLAFVAQFLERLRALPGVDRAGAGMGIPFAGGAYGEYFRQPGGSGDEGALGSLDFVSPGFLEALGVRLRGGRLLTDADMAGAGARVAVLNEHAARRFFQPGQAVGQVLSIGGAEWRIVGVVADVVDRRLDGGRRPYAWVPVAFNTSRLSFAVRTSGMPLALVDGVRQELASVDPGVAVAAPRALDRVRAGSMTPRKVVLGLVASFAGAALLLAAVGIYGVMAYVVATRRREIGIRLALGALQGVVIRQVMAGGVPVLIAGLTVGLAGAVAAARLLASELYEVRASDPLVLTVSVVTIASTALLACWLPTWRATRVDPLTSLRSE